MTDKRSILITGASSGIGRAAAVHLAGKGFRIYAGIRKEADGKALREASSSIIPLQLDVTRPEHIESAAQTLASDHEYPLFGLVNNAGIGISSVVEATETEDFRKVLEVNVLGLQAVTKAVLPLLRKNAGRIVNVGSSASYMSGPRSSAYAASKFAVRALSDSLRIEVKEFGMFVSLVAPGAVESDIWGKYQTYLKENTENTPEAVRDAYRMFFDFGASRFEEVKKLPALAVAKAIEHALTSRRPQSEYLVGSEAKKVFILSRLPKWLYNWIVYQFVKQKSHK